MGAFAGWFLGIFSWLAGFFGQWLAKKTAFGAAAVATFGVLTVAFYASLSGLFSLLTFVFPVSGNAMAVALWLAVPDQVPVAVSVCVAADTAVSLYRWNVENLKIVSYIT